MDEEKEETINQEEIFNENKTLDLVANDVLILKSNNLIDPVSKNTTIEIKRNVENFDDKDFVWGIKQSGNKYKTVTIKNELYALNDCVCCRSGLELDYIGKIMKLSQENDQKVCTLRWFFRPFELPTSLKEIYKSANTRELFLAFGEGIGVENKNFLVSCYNMNNIRSYFNVENVVSLEVITGKCKVLCIAKDDFNNVPSNEDLDMCDFFFNKAFNCDTLNIVSLDGVVDAIGAQKVYNKKEWLNWNKNDIHSISLNLSPKKILCQSFDSSSLAISLSDVNVSPVSTCCNVSSLIIGQSIKKTTTKKRKRDSLEKVMPPKKMMDKAKKIKLSSTSKYPKLYVIEDEATNQEYQATNCVNEVKSNITIVDALDICMENSGPNLYEGSKLVLDENLNSSSEDDKIDENPKFYIDLSSNIPIIFEQTTESIENNADDIHITCEEFPIENILEPIEKSKSSTNKLNKDESSLNSIVPYYGASEIGKTLNSKINKIKFAKERMTNSKGVQNKNIKNLSNDIIDTTSKEPTKENSTKSSVSKRTQEEIECEVWDDEIQKAIVAKRVLLLNNLDPELHSMELQEALSKFLETKCQVQKIMPNSFYYSTASALLKLSTPDIAQRSLQNLCKDCLIVGDRTIVAALYEDLEGAKEFYDFYGHICIQPNDEALKQNCIEMNVLPHAAQGDTIEFTFGLRWRLLQEQHELQWQLLNELHEKELNIIIKETKGNK